MTGYTDEPVEILADDECWRLAAGGQVARLAVAVGGEPDIYPITAATRDGAVVFRTAEGTKLLSLVINERVAVEFDGVEDGSAWSVVLKGTARRLETSAEIEAAEGLALTPQIATVKSTYVEVAPTHVSGRRFRLAGED
ncbi:pyridoxamine 5'-phosphate oxidase family protein [Oerskovia flava]|uniref:pyridoxamine 5'-phosphate oxidase family protein n=1 Tax=Oerskovia flava TaxID=2986422 RepID=UPI00223EB72A|nr:pyridoxamine 5'-phosphate oxidase family protein [Oerskovia sp. JB1-3-2]